MIADQALFRWQILGFQFWQCLAIPAILAIVSMVARESKPQARFLMRVSL